MNSKKEDKKKRGGLPTQMGLIFRIVAGAYLIYLAYSIFNGSGNIEGTERIVFIAAVAIFVVVGAVIVFTSLRAMQRGEYDGGPGDPRKNDQNDEEKKEISGTDRIRFGEPETMPDQEKED